MAYTVFSMGNEGKIKSFSRLYAVASHNARMALGTNEKNIDNANPDYDGFNQDLMPMFRGQSYVAFDDIRDKYAYDGFKLYTKWMERMSTIDYYQGKKYNNIKKNTNLALEFVVSFSSDASDNINLAAWKQANIEWFNKTFNVAPDKKNNIISAICHLDEKTAHIHFIVVPVDEKGRLNSQRWIGGTDKMCQLRESYDNAMEHLGLERGVERSRASKGDLPHIYKLIQQCAVLPEREANETLEDFTERTLEYLRAESAKETLRIKEAESESLRAISIAAEEQRKEIELELVRARKTLPKDVSRLEEQKQYLTDELAELNERIAKDQEIINDAIRLRVAKKVRDYYRKDPTINEAFDTVINAINGYDDALERELIKETEEMEYDAVS